MKYFYHLAWAAILAGIALILTLFSWYVSPYTVLTFGEGNGTVLDPRYKPGEYIRLRQVYCKYTDLQSTISRQFIDSIVYQVPLTTNDRPQGCGDKVEYIYIPKALPPGKYFLSTVISFKVNPIRTVSYTIRTNEFEVIK